MDGRYEKPYKIFIRKDEGKRPFGKPRRKWEDKYKHGHYGNRVLRHGLDASC